MAIPIEIDIEEGQEEEAAEEKKKGGLLIPGVAALVVGAGAAAGAYFLTPAKVAPVEGEETQLAEAHGAGKGDAKDKGHSDKKKKKGKGSKKGGDEEFAGGKLKMTEEAAFFILDPLVISIRPIGDTRHLRISLVLETSSYQAESLLGRIFHVQDVLNTYLRSVDRNEFEDPAAMMRLRSQIRRRVQAAAPGVKVDNVLITEFILT